MQIVFRAVDEPKPGAKWQALFGEFWPAYRQWFLSEGIEQRPTYKVCRDRIAERLPGLLPLYEELCALAGGGDLASRFLSLYRPPAYISGCSQAAWSDDEPLLVRNYDYAPALCDGIILRSAWGGKRVICMSDCMWGCLDGVNEDGLAVSLTFGGRRVVGDGFGIPVVLRHVLQQYGNVIEAAEALKRIPVHMAYNVTLLDASGGYRTVFMAPDRDPVVKSVAIATNHQGRVEWHDHARATATIEREQFLRFRLEDPKMSSRRLVDAFSRPPLYTNAYRTGFGTLYTAIYKPASGEVEYRWPGGRWSFSFDRFHEGARKVVFAPS
jgi:predicted choloylglycine hydrolase